MLKPEAVSNPLYRWLDANHLTPGQFSIMANVDHAAVYQVLYCQFKKLPQSFASAIDACGAEGDGQKIARAYEVYREGLRSDLLNRASVV